MIKPLKDYILVVPDKPKEQVSKGGIIMPGQIMDKINATQGIVEEIGSDVERVKKGDYVIFNHRVRIILNDDLGEKIERFFVKEENILGIIK